MRAGIIVTSRSASLLPRGSQHNSRAIPRALSSSVRVWCVVWVLSSAYRSPASTTSTVTVCGVSNVSLRGGREIRGRNEPTARVLRQSVGNNQPRRPASDHDVVVARLQLAIEPVRVEKQPPRQGDKEYKEKHWPLPGEQHVARATRDKRIAVATRFAAWDTDEGSHENQKIV